MSKIYTITAKSKPDYDDWGPDSYWSIQNWISFESALVNEYGKEKGQADWLAYFKRGNGFEFGPARAGYLTDKKFADWLKSRGLYDQVATGLNGLATDTLLTVYEGGRTITQAASSTLKNTANALKFTSFILPIVVIIVVFIGYKFLNQKLGIKA